MHRLFFIFIIFSVFVSLSFSDNLNEYFIIKIKDIQAGKEEGLIGWEPAVAGGFSGPTSFAISNNGKLYIPDRVNYRINVYDLNFNFIKTIIEKKDKKAHFTKKLQIDDDGNLIYLSSSKGLVKIDNDGNNLFTVMKQKLPRRVTQYNIFFPIADDIFIYSDKDEIECITNKGEIIKGGNIKPEINKIENKWANSSKVDSIVLPDSLKKIITDFQQNNSLLIINDNLYSADFQKNKEYFKHVKVIKEYVKSEKSILRKGEVKKELNINLDDYDYTFLDYDNDHNGYWLAGKQEDNDTRNRAIIIINKYGEVLDGFYFGQYYKNKPNLELYPTSSAEVAIAPSGDIYFLTGSKEKYTLYKVERQW